MQRAMNRTVRGALAIALLASVGLCGCGNGEDKPKKSPTPAEKAATPAEAAKAEPAASPTKETLIAKLRTALALLEAKKYDEAMKHFKAHPGIKPSDLAGLVSRKEISKAGIDRLEKDAPFGKADKVFKPERAAYFAKKMGADVTKCYGLHLEPAEVVAEWDGTDFRIIRLDDVGKLK